MITFIWKLWSNKEIVGIGLLVVIGLVTGAYLKGGWDQKEANIAKVNAERIETIGKAKRNEQKVQRMPESDLDKSLDSWMRD